MDLAAVSGKLPATTAPRSPAKKWGMLLVLSLALFVIILDTTILNVALSAIIRDLKANIQSIQWVITAYSLTIAALTVTGGRLGDLFGRKRMFIVGACLFAAGSFIASISTSVPMLIMGESIIEGIGAALMMPATASLLVANFHGRERALAFGVWGGVAGAGAALGPIVGGYLTTNWNWRWGFRVNLFVIAILLVGTLLIPESEDTKEAPSLDFGGVVLSALGLLSFVFGVIEASQYGWWKAKAAFAAFGHMYTFPGNLSVTPFAIVIGVIILALFVFWEQSREREGKTPLVSMKLFRNRQFTSGIITTAILSLGQTGLIFALPIFLQSVRGLNAFQTGLSLLPMSLALLIVAPAAAVLSKKIPPKFIIAAGLLINACSYLVLHGTLAVTTNRVDLIPGLALFGIGMGLVMSQISNLTLSAVSVDQAGEASGVNNTMRQVGATLGSAIIGTILLSSLSTNLVNLIQASPVLPEALKPTIAQAFSSHSSSVEFGDGVQGMTNFPPAIQAELTSITHTATVQANKQSLLFGAIFAFIGFLSSFFLPREGRKPQSLAPTMVKRVAPVPVTTTLSTEGLARFLALEQDALKQGQPGFAQEIQYLIDTREAGLSIADWSDPRALHARVLWDRGVGEALGISDFQTYLASIPEVPESFRSPNGAFPLLLLIDARLSARRLAELLGVRIEGTTNTHEMARLQETGEIYWLRVQTDTRYLGQSVEEAVAQFAPRECGLNEQEGLYAYAAQPDLIQEYYLDLPCAIHEGYERNAACLGIWNGCVSLRWRWSDHADPRCRTASALMV